MSPIPNWRIRIVPVIVYYLATVTLMSIVSFVAYGVDKKQAGNGSRRIRERTLHLLAFLGGWPSAWFAQRHFRQKTRKRSFQIVFWLVVAVHTAIVGTVLYLCYGSFEAK